MTTEPPNLLQLAKQGDVQAIAVLINRNLNSRGITAKVGKKGDCLRVLLEAAEIPNQTSMVTFIHSGIQKLGITNFNSLQVIGKQTDDKLPSWSQTLNLKVSNASEVEIGELKDLYQRTDKISILIDKHRNSEPTIKLKTTEETAGNIASCPNCGSNHITLKTETTVNWGRAVAGWAMFGVVGGAVGAVTGKDRDANACLNCGTTWKAKDLYEVLQVIKQSTGAILNLSNEQHRLYMNSFLAEVGPYLQAISDASNSAEKLIKEKKDEEYKETTEGCSYGCMASIMCLFAGVLTAGWIGVLIILALPIGGLILGQLADRSKKESVAQAIAVANKSSNTMQLEAERKYRAKVEEFMSKWH